MLRFVEVEVRVRGGVGFRFVRVWVEPEVKVMNY